MASLIFPSEIMLPSYPLKQTSEDNSLKSAFEDGSVQARRKFTGSRKTFTVTWNALPKEQFLILDDFITNKACFSANSFLWTNPADGKQREVYVEEYTDSELSVLNYWKVAVSLRAVQPDRAVITSA